MKKLALATIAVMATTLPQGGLATTEGKEAYTNFRCGGCHGENGKGSSVDLNAKPIAGMNAQSMLRTVNRLIEQGGHQEHMGTGCAETPTKAEIEAIATYVASLPR